jgi:hypothetical protein
VKRRQRQWPTLRGLFNASFYVALARAAFAGEGVEIRFTSSPHPDETALCVMDGTADVTRGGPIRVVCLGEVVMRGPLC